MAVTREQLYKEVWADPMLQVAARHQVSASFLARVCRRMNVPCPPRGYWQKHKAGTKTRVPLLPPPRPGDEVSWSKGGGGERLPPKPPSIKEPRPTKELPVQVDASGRHRHLVGVEDHFKVAGETGYGYLKPSKRLMADFFVSKALVPRAIEVANQFFLALGAAGRAVGFSAAEGAQVRPDLVPYKGEMGLWFSTDSWRPYRPTVAWFGTMAIGLTVFEVSELAEATYVNGKRVRVSELPIPKRRPAHAFLLGGTPYPFLTGRLAIRASSPYWDVTWERQWEESEPGELVGMIDEIISSLKRHAAMLAPQVREAMEKRRQEDEARKAAHAVWLKEEAIRQEALRQEAEAKARAQAIQDSRKDLFDLIRRWGEARRVQAFVQEVEAAISALDSTEQVVLLERLHRIKGFLGEVDPIQAIKDWKAPEER